MDYLLFFVVNMDMTVHMTDIKTIIIHSIEDKAIVWNMGWKKGTYITINRSPNEHNTDRIRGILVSGFILSIDLCSERHSKTKNSCESTKDAKAQHLALFTLLYVR